MTNIAAADIFEGLSYVSPAYIEEADADRLSVAKPRLSKTARTLLIAAIITALLAGTAYGVGVSIQKARQERLAGALKVEENKVTGYMEYEEPGPTPSEATVSAQPEYGIKLLSSIRDSKFQRLYISVSPVTEEIAWSSISDNAGPLFTFAVSNTEDMEREFYLASSDAEHDQYIYRGIAQPVFIPGADISEHMIGFRDEVTGITHDIIDPDYRKQTAFEESYDAETQSLMLECTVRLNSSGFNIDWDLPVYLAVKCLDTRSVTCEMGTDMDEYKRNYNTVYLESYGTVLLETAQPEYREFNFETPIELSGPDAGICKVLGVKVYPTGAQWRLIHDGIDEIFDLDSADENFHETYEKQLAWLSFYDAMLSGSYLTFLDGSTFQLMPSNSCPYEEGVVTLFSDWDSTIDISKINSLSIMGQTYKVR